MLFESHLSKSYKEELVISEVHCRKYLFISVLLDPGLIGLKKKSAVRRLMCD